MAAILLSRSLCLPVWWRHCMCVYFLTSESMLCEFCDTDFSLLCPICLNWGGPVIRQGAFIGWVDFFFKKRTFRHIKYELLSICWKKSTKKRKTLIIMPVYLAFCV
jgi:hypothetical protein